MNRTRRKLVLSSAAFVAAPALIACNNDKRPKAATPPLVPAITPRPLTVAKATFPLQIHPGGRYLTDSDGRPLLLHGDTPWSIAVQLTRAQIDTYLDDRLERGFNAILFNGIEHYFSSNHPFYRNAEGYDPFVEMTRFSMPNPKYWELVDHIVSGCERRGIVCLMAPAYLGYGGGSGTSEDQGWNSEVDAAIDSDLQSYGRFLADRYARRNVIWVLGGDFNPPDPSKQWNIALGIRSVDQAALITGHGARSNESYVVWNGRQGWNINNIYVGMDGVAYKAAKRAYSRGGPVPFFLIEGAYGNAQSDDACRLQAYQSILGGACGHFFGTYPLWGFGEPHANGGIGPHRALASSLTTPATNQIGHLIRLFSCYPWWNLVPSSDRRLIRDDLLAGANRICAARATDGSFAMIWTTAGHSFTVNLAALAGSSVRVLWHDTINGIYQGLAGSPYRNTGAFSFAAPGEGVLILDSA